MAELVKVELTIENGKVIGIAVNAEECGERSYGFQAPSPIDEDPARQLLSVTVNVTQALPCTVTTNGVTSRLQGTTTAYHMLCFPKAQQQAAGQESEGIDG